MSLSFLRSSHSCPRCMTPMVLGHAGGMELHGCSTCGGIWLDTEAAQKFAEGLPNKAIALAIHHAVSAKDAVETGALIACPVCGTTMQRTHVAAANLDLDVCNTHGTWYDRNELERIAQAIKKTRWGTENMTPFQSLGPNAKFKPNAVDRERERANVAADVRFVANAARIYTNPVGAVFRFFGWLFE